MFNIISLAKLLFSPQNVLKHFDFQAASRVVSYYCRNGVVGIGLLPIITSLQANAFNKLKQFCHPITGGANTTLTTKLSFEKERNTLALKAALIISQ